MKSRVFPMACPDQLMDAVDRARGKVSRAAWIREACRAKLGRKYKGVVHPVLGRPRVR